MRTIISISNDQMGRIQRLLDSNLGYADLNQFIGQAIQNQIILEEDGLKEESSARTPITQNEQGHETSKTQSIQVRNYRAEKPITSQIKVDIASLAPVQGEVLTVSPRELSALESTTPLYGLTSRYAPVKVALRLLASSLEGEKTEWIKLDTVWKRLDAMAPGIKKTLQRIDTRDLRQRGKGLSTGFPDGDKVSNQRFLSQYLGYFASMKGEPRGLLVDLGLANMRSDNEGVWIGITKVGLEYSKLESPLIDEVIIREKKSSSPFSGVETQFLVSHLRNFRPGEIDFLEYVAETVSEFDQPSTLLPKVKEYFEKKLYGEKITEAFINTMRAGAVSKLVELGVLEIEKDGQYSIYSVTKQGLDILRGGRVD